MYLAVLTQCNPLIQPYNGQVSVTSRYNKAYMSGWLGRVGTVSIDHIIFAYVDDSTVPINASAMLAICGYLPPFRIGLNFRLQGSIWFALSCFRMQLSFDIQTNGWLITG